MFEPNEFKKNETNQSRAAVVSEKFSKVSKVFEKVKWDLRNDLPTEIPKLTKPVFKFIIEISKNELAMEISKKCHAVIAEEVVSEKVFQSVKSYKKVLRSPKVLVHGDGDLENNLMRWSQRGLRQKTKNQKPKPKSMMHLPPIWFSLCLQKDFASEKSFSISYGGPKFMVAGKSIDNRRSRNHKARSIDG